MKKQLLALATGVTLGVSGAVVTVGGEDIIAHEITPRDLYGAILIQSLIYIKIAQTKDGQHVTAKIKMDANSDGFQSFTKTIGFRVESDAIKANIKSIEDTLRKKVCKENKCNDKSLPMAIARAAIVEGGEYTISAKFLDGKKSLHTGVEDSVKLGSDIQSISSWLIDEWCEKEGNKLCPKG